MILRQKENSLIFDRPKGENPANPFQNSVGKHSDVKVAGRWSSSSFLVIFAFRFLYFFKNEFNLPRPIPKFFKAI